MLPRVAKDALKAGKVDIRVMRSGTLQFQEFVIKRLPLPIGQYPVLSVDKFIDMSELLRLAEEYQLPVSAKNGTAFPRGKTAKDFVGL
ncbi:MAG: hypothetical protein NTY73_00255 [Candidatus Micrarchaeota archaeon]|nr:hypothetical protein [Candidatus Micrarchaeota archaeon]